MKLVTYLAAILAVASSDPVYTTQPTEHFVNNAEAYQSALEHQQQGVYGDQSQYSQQFSQSDASYSQGHAAYPSGQFGQNSYTGQNAFAEQNYQQRPSTEKSARILNFQNENKGKSYQYSYETENGIKVQERGEVQGKSIRAQGGYSYTGDDGKVYTVTYTADENGFHPRGDHLPTPPPIPEAIQKSIELNVREAANGVYDDGSYKEENELVRQNQKHQQHQQLQQHQVQIQHIPEIQQINQLSEIQQIHQITEIQQIHQIPEIQQIHQIPEIQQVQQVQQVQHFQNGQELYENGYHENYQEVTPTTAGYHYLI